MSKNIILNCLKDKKILILGFGREGKSTFRFINENISNPRITVADENPNTDISEILQHKYPCILGNDYLQNITNYDIIIKSPGISLKKHFHLIQNKIITSQTDLFLQAYANQCIGITGTKGKSTTTNLIFHIFQKLNIPSLMAGNMGIPLFDIIPQLKEEDKIVLELSSHQLEFIQKAPHIALLLNLFEEHLDHYNSFYDYQSAKFNIATYQQPNDYFIYNACDELVLLRLIEKNPSSQKIGFSYYPYNKSSCYVKENRFIFKKNENEITLFKIDDTFPLKGNHNLQNTCAALLAVLLSENISDYAQLQKAVYSFQSLPHRLEFVATINGISFYNDSISTIPQATLAAIEAIKNVNTLILGGMDRGIDYTPLIKIFTDSVVENFIFTGKAGERMMHLCPKPTHKNFYFSNDYTEIVAMAKQITRKNCCCLLSPAASSYDAFKNFEERGDVFKKLIKEQSTF